MTDEEYNLLPEVRSSDVKAFWTPKGKTFSVKSALHKLRDHKDEKFFKMGNATHDFIEHKGRFSVKYVQSNFENGKTAGLKAFEKEHSEQIVLTLKDAKEAISMGKAVMRECPEVMNHSFETEKVVVREGLKCKMDGFYKGIAYDWKTTRHDNFQAIQSDFYKLGYHISYHHYKLVAGFEEMIFGFVCSSGANESWRLPMSDELKALGEKDWEVCYERYMRYKDLDIKDAPGRATGEEILDVPEWAMDDVDFNDIEEIE